MKIKCVLCAIAPIPCVPRIPWFSFSPFLIRHFEILAISSPVALDTAHRSDLKLYPSLK